MPNNSAAAAKTAKGQKPFKTNGLRRVLALVWKHYRFQVIAIAVLIIATSLCTVYGSTFQLSLIHI